MYSTKRMIFLSILFHNLIVQVLSAQQGNVSVEYGRISNIADNYIHVASSLTLTDCIRKCVDFTTSYPIYTYETCFAYNYDFDHYTCELIHSIQPMSYSVSFQTRWQTGFKN